MPTDKQHTKGGSVVDSGIRIISGIIGRISKTKSLIFLVVDSNFIKIRKSMTLFYPGWNIIVNNHIHTFLQGVLLLLAVKLCGKWQQKAGTDKQKQKLFTFRYSESH